MIEFFGKNASSYHVYVWAGAICFVTLYAWMKMGNVDKKKQKKSVPMAPGSLWEVLDVFLSEKGPMYLLDMCREVGKVIALPIAPPGSRYVVVTEPRLARTILEDPKNPKWPQAYEFMDFVTGGNNLFSAEGARYRHARKSTAAAFSPQNLSHMEQIVEQTLDDWIDKKKLQSSEQVIEMGDEMQRISMQIASQIVLGDALSENDLEMALQLFSKVNEEFFFKTPKNPLRRLFGWAIPEVREAYRAAAWLQNLCKRMLDRCKKEEEVGSNHKQATVMHHILNDQEYRDDQERTRDLLIYLFGGLDTVSSSITWGLLELARNPDIQQWLRQEVLKTKDDYKNCQALSMMVREVMRLHTAPAMGPVRIATKEMTHENTVIPTKSILQLPFYVIHRDGDVFEDPDRFVPSRWENPSPAMQRAYMPFAVGRRSCPGQLLANTEARMILAKLCADYEWTIVEQGKVSFCVTLKAVGVLLKAKKL